MAIKIATGASAYSRWESALNASGKCVTHGGKRAGAGRPTKDMYVSRVYALHDSGVSNREIARRFFVSHPTIARLLKIRYGRL